MTGAGERGRASGVGLSGGMYTATSMATITVEMAGQPSSRWKYREVGLWIFRAL